MAKIAAIIVNWKQPELTIKTVDSLLATNYKPHNLIIYIVDNCSPDKSFSILRNHYSRNKKIKVIKTTSNGGFSGGNNFGILKASKIKPDYYLIANNDILFDKNFIKPLVNPFSKDKYLAATSPKIYFAPGYEYKNTYSKDEIGKVFWSLGGTIDWDNVVGNNFAIDEVDRGQYDNNLPKLDWVTGCCLLVKASAMDKLKGFNDKYFMYLEDLDFSVRLQKLGLKFMIVTESVIWHLNSASSGAASELHNYFMTRNRLIFGFKYASLKTKMALFKHSITQLFTTPSVWQKRGIVDYYLNKLGKGSWK